MLNDDERWVLSYYRTSELGGALFFGRLARILRPGPIQVDMTKHFADESAHAFWWTECLERLDSAPIRVTDAYQDRYLEAIGLPVNLMEILAVTHVFERRAIGQYARHARSTDVQPEIRATLERILRDERWHLEWVSNALRGLEGEYGTEEVRSTLRRFEAADREVYETTIREHGERVAHLLGKPTRTEERS